jgi:hypothetical protein
LISTTTTKKTLLQMCVSVCALTSRKTWQIHLITVIF